LAKAPAHHRDFDRMMKLLRDAQQEYGDTLPLESANPRPAEIDLSNRRPR
jgi:hypothetical protein